MLSIAARTAQDQHLVDAVSKAVNSLINGQEIPVNNALDEVVKAVMTKQVTRLAHSSADVDDAYKFAVFPPNRFTIRYSHRRI